MSWRSVVWQNRKASGKAYSSWQQWERGGGLGCLMSDARAICDTVPILEVTHSTPALAATPSTQAPQAVLGQS